MELTEARQRWVRANQRRVKANTALQAHPYSPSAQDAYAAAVDNEEQAFEAYRLATSLDQDGVYIVEAAN